MANQYQQYQPQAWSVPAGPQTQPQVFVPSQAPSSGMFPGGGQTGNLSNLAADPFLSGMAGTMLRQQGQNYFQRSQAFVQSKMSFLSGSMIQYLFAVSSEYVAKKLALLLFPFIGRSNFSRAAEQLTGGHKYLPPKQDVNAPDLYLPTMGLWTYSLLVGLVLFARQSFRPEAVYSTVSSALLAWIVHTMALKAVLWVLGIASAAPVLELASYAGYTFLLSCIILVGQLAFGRIGYHVALVYTGLAMSVFIVRTMKRVIFQEASHYSHNVARHNYLLLGIAIFQFPLLAWLCVVPS